ncbi:MAG TPA: recombinase family protein [Hyphomonadaceae bacterium]|nr:recombinase family protein [Hyphomonadaceae bacterium]
MARKTTAEAVDGQRTRFRCAIYTRKSSEEGLEQDFNSLDAQREACEAYIVSQKHEGWITLPQAYDDGGFSGGTMERPALQRLLADVAAGKVDVIVVYKVDRLTRALSDFSKIVDILDGKGASFVSVTQQFNTTTSMGRLTLNVLLSFAQFEREVTSERIRDKIAASKKKGMWMGGMAPLGYDVLDHKLVVNPAEAETVRAVFRAYQELKSVSRLKEHLDATGIVSKTRKTAAGTLTGGRPIARGALYLMLQNRIYRGEIVHKDKAYPGGHEAIVDEDLWSAVQTILAENRVDRTSGRGVIDPSLLAGMLFDARSERMTPSHAVKKGKRYRYYVSSHLVSSASEGHGQRLPAPEIERIVVRRLGDWFADAPAATDALAGDGPELGAPAQRTMVDAIARIAKRWPELPRDELRQLLLTVDARIQVHVDRVDISLSATGLRQWLTDPHRKERHGEIGRSDSAAANPGDEPSQDRNRIHLPVAARLQRAGVEMKLIVSDGTQPPEIDRGLVRTLIRANRIRQQLAQDPGLSLSDVAEHEGIVPSYATRIYRLSFLAPDIIEAMLEGRQPPALTLRKLLDDTRLPLDWTEQRQRLGFV